MSGVSGAGATLATSSRRGSPYTWRILLGGVLLLALVAAMVVHLQHPTGALGDGTFLAVNWTASVAAWIGVRRAPRSVRLVPLLIAGGITASGLGDLTFIVYVWTGTTPNVSPADILWFSSYIGLVAALFITLVRDRGRFKVDMDAVIDVLTVVAVSVLVFWNLSITGIISDGTVSAFVRTVWAGYPVADAVLFALVLRALVSRRGRDSVGFTFAFGVACWLAADLGFLLFTVSGGYSGWLDLGWMLGVLLMARSAWLRPALDRAESEETATETGSGLGKLGIAIVPLMVPPVLALLDELRGRPAHQLEAVVGMAVLLTLAFARTARLLKSEERARASARKSHRHYACLAANSSDAVIVVDADGRIINESPQLARLVGFEGATNGVDWMLPLSPVDFDGIVALFASVIGAPGEILNTEVQVNDGSGSRVWLGARIVNLLHDPDVEGVIIALHDISDRKRAEAEVAHQAFHDGLTGLPNRALFRDRVGHALRGKARSGLEPAVLYLDVDGFKAVNDTFGHEVGDDLLCAVTRRLLDAVRSSDTVARLGGDEFAILIEASPRPVQEAIMIADRILQGLTAPFEINGSRITTSVSIGIADGDGHSSATSLIRNADIAMYSAKRNGKAQRVTYVPHMRAVALEQLQLETELSGALERNEFQLVYQPVVRLETQQIVGLEALLRWHHPSLGVIEPDTFIPIAEESGSIVAIGQWVLRTACEAGARWQRMYPQHQTLSMAVNLSARQLADEELVVHVIETLASSGLDPSTLVLEMTETALIRDPALAARRLHELRRLAVHLAIDDFGTGYSSLSYLRQFPFDILKIDRSFVNAITDRAEVPAIVRGLLDLGRTLDLEMIAEGVENDIQRDGLRLGGCQFGQGYLFARPLAPQDAEAMLSEPAISRSPQAPAPDQH